jgi:hypothetical protein
MLGRKSFKLQVFEGRVLKGNLQLAWTKEEDFLCVGKDHADLKEQQYKEAELHN